MTAGTTKPALTDSRISLAADEFVWSNPELSGAHSYLSAPTIRILKSFRARKVLDLGCGNGAFAALLAANNFLVSGCDGSGSGIRLARTAFPNIAFFQHDLSKALPPWHAGLYDAVVSLEVIEHLFFPRLLPARAFQELRPGGLFIVTTPFHGYWKNLALAITNKFDEHWHPLRDFGHIKFFSKRTLLSLLRESGFKVVDFLKAGRFPLLPCSMIVAATKPER
jgi:2-polyprenyl-6-hydroxyphenyl methylase/3-demethylubiquinone-9 3-methyltransferase